MFWFLPACVTSVPAHVEAPPVVVERAPYEDVLREVGAERTRLRGLERTEARQTARAYLLDSWRDTLVPYWLGTPWAFYGQTTVPGEGSIACGYFVSTTLEDLGLKVERVRMAQQASEYIVKTFAPPSDIARFRKGDRSAVVDWVRTQPDNLYAVGLDYHVGVLVKRGDTVEFCHSAVTGTQSMVCGDPLTDDGFISRYHVVGPILSDRIVDAWLDEKNIRTVLP